MLTGLLIFYVLFVVLRDSDKVAYKLWAYYHDYVFRPYQSRRGHLYQRASNSTPPLTWMRTMPRG